MAIFNRSKRIKHTWDYIPYFHVAENMVIAVQVCRKTGACRYVRVPSSKKLDEMERSRDNESD